MNRQGWRRMSNRALLLLLSLSLAAITIALASNGDIIIRHDKSHEDYVRFARDCPETSSIVAFSRMDLLERLQGEAYSPYERTIDAHIKNLRAKIEPEPAQPQYILTVFGVGYKMAKDEEM